MDKFNTHFCGNEISPYGKANGFVDYRAFANSFDAVMSNDIITATNYTCGEWEQINGFIDNYDAIAEIEEKIEAVEEEINEGTTEELYNELTTKIEELKEEIEELKEEEENPGEIFQYFIVSSSGADIIQEFTNDPLFYNNFLDMYVWGVTHWGTSWDYVLTNIPCEISKQ